MVGIPEWQKVFFSRVKTGPAPSTVEHAGVNIQMALPCIEWTGATDNKGYGIMRVPKGYMGLESGLVRVHRLAYYIKKKFPTNAQIDHLCRNKKCIRFTHLELLGEKEHGRISREDQG